MADPSAKKILDLFKSSKTWDFDRYAIDRHRGFFVRRRASFLSKAHADWISDPAFTTIIGRIDSELTEVEAYVTTKLGPLTRDGSAPADRTKRGPLYGGAGDGSPLHLDLADVAQIKTRDPASTVAEALAHPKTQTDRRARNYLDRRKDRVLAIVWRAAALSGQVSPVDGVLHDPLWAESADKKTAILVRTQMDQILDRRLRVVEHMNYRIASHDSMDKEENIKPSKPKLMSPVGPWIDGYRVRCFEYPRVPNTSAYRAAIGPANIGPSTAPYDAYPWTYSADRKRRRLEYNKGPQGFNFNPVLEPNVKYDPSYKYEVEIAPSNLTAAGTMDEFVRPDTDFWIRSWIFCDHVVTATNLEALLFALRRRDKGSDTAFNAIITGNPIGYVEIGVVLSKSGPADFHQIMADAHDKYFENTEVWIDDFQVGDHVVFYNSYVYQLISSNDWRLENTLVMDVDSDPDRDSGDPPDPTGKHRWKNMKLQGHGTAINVYADYIDEIRGNLQTAIENAYDLIAAAPAGTTQIPIGGTRLVKWTPYENFSNPAWWVEVPLVDKAGKTQFKSLAAAKSAVQKTVVAAQSAPPAGGYTPPPRPADAVYFPLYEPQFEGDGGWESYLTQRAIDATVKPPQKLPRKLRPVKIDGSIMPGFFFRGTSFPTPAVRPKALP
jgi:hypothetical protein